MKKRNTSQSIEECYEQIKKQKEYKKQVRDEQFECALKEVRRVLGYKPVGKYTVQDAEEFLIKKYGAKEITKKECCNYVPIHFEYDEDKFISRLTDWYNDESCYGIYLLPSLQIMHAKKIEKDKGAVCILINEGDKLDGLWCGGDTAGYNDLYYELAVFKAECMETPPNKKQREKEEKIKKWEKDRYHMVSIGSESAKILEEQGTTGFTKQKNAAKRERFWQSNKPE